jgi:hypothetical protein
MFGSIASRYDLLNHLLSVNVDKRWRRLVATRVRDKLPSESARVLDVACGTGDLSLTLFEITGQELLGLISAGRCWTSLPVRRLVAYALLRVMRWTFPFEMAHSTLRRSRLDCATCRMSKVVWRNSPES